MQYLVCRTAIHAVNGCEPDIEFCVSPNNTESHRMNVCENCIDDPDLKAVVRENADEFECDYCNRKATEPFACDLCYINERISYVIEQYFDDPNNFMYWIDGDWAGQPVYDIHDVLQYLDFELQNEHLYLDITASFLDEQYANPYFWPGEDHERQFLAWERFKHCVKHGRRYTFYLAKRWTTKEYDELPPNKILPVIADTIKEVGLAFQLPPGHLFWRARQHNNKAALKGAKEFTSPPERAAQANRMSPSGIPMFYASEDFDTAIVETHSPVKDQKSLLTAVQFRNIIPLQLLDLTAIPACSTFSSAPRQLRQSIKFLEMFAADIAKPISRDGTEHTEYVPTQAVTEFIRFEMKINRKPIDGLKFTSSKTARPCYVIFAEKEQCLPKVLKNVGLPQMLQFVRGSYKTKTFAKNSRKR